MNRIVIATSARDALAERYLSSTFAGANVELRPLARLKYSMAAVQTLDRCRVQVAGWITASALPEAKR